MTTPDLVTAVLARIYVDDLPAALPLYERLAAQAAPHRFGFRGLRLATVGRFLLIEGADDAVRSRTATLVVSDIDAVAEVVSDGGGALLEGPAAGPNGRRLIARHPDGSVVEYLQLA